MKITVVILAAGQGTRMHSALPKALHPLLGKPMILYALETSESVSRSKPVVVIGHGADEIRALLGDNAQFVLQEPQLGTGHALLLTEGILRDQTDLVLVMTADMPLLKRDTLIQIVEAQGKHSGPITMLTFLCDDPRGFGRVLRDENGCVSGIIEEAQATPDQLSIRELNASVYCFDANWLWEALKHISISPKGEYYLTDLVAIAVADGKPIQALRLEDTSQLIGINTRIHLAEAERLLRREINQHWMLSGVTLVDPESIYIEPDVSIGADTVVWPNTYLQGTSQIGKGCSIGPNAILRDSQIGNYCKVSCSTIENAVVEDEVDIGPYAHLRKGTILARGVHVGNFGEVKNASLGPGTKMGHFSYIGDADIGPGVNIGAGTITCNFDGTKKNKTEIEADVFLGSDTMLVAPVKLEHGSRTGAGSVVTKNVPADTLVAGVPARAIRKLKKND